MKKISFQTRVTLITAICIAISGFVMYFSLLRLAEIKIVQPVEIKAVEAGSTLPNQNDSSYVSEEFSIGEEITGENTYASLAQTGFQKFQIVGALVVLLIIGGGSGLAWFVSGFAISPIKQLSQKVESVDANQMELDISEFSAGDELNKLADSFSQMMKRIQTAFEREKRFSRAAAHELKTPLAVMQSSIDILELSDKPSIEEYQEAIEDISFQVTRLTDLVTDLLAFTNTKKIESSNEIKVIPLIEQLLEEITSQYPNIIIKKDLSPVDIVINQNLLERAIYNLLENAAKYSPKDGTLLVTLFKEDDSFVLKISDEGCGISSESSEHIFEPFYREDSSRNRSIAGAGLGLAFVKEFTENYGGNIFFTSGSHGGTEFTLILPLDQRKCK